VATAGGAVTKFAVSRRRTLTALLRRAVLRPELTALAGCIAVFTYFALAAGSSGFLSATSLQNTLEIAADIGIIAAPVTLLMIAGEFDLSVGSMVGVSQILITYPLVYHHWPLWAALLFAVAVAAGVGAINGLIVVKTGLPSFIVTLAALFWIRGIGQGVTQELTTTSVVGNPTAAAHGDFSLDLFKGAVLHLPADFFWWTAVTLLAIWILDRTRAGNWIYASGGLLDSAKKAGVPSDRLKVALFMCTAASTVIVGALTTFAIDQGDVNVAVGREFEVVTAAVIGGSVLTGGFGSAMGTALGALLFGMVETGFFFTNIPGTWYQTFLGFMLLIAVFINTSVRRAALTQRAAPARERSK
jgi:simple sugar transport system permease protein